MNKDTFELNLAGRIFDGENDVLTISEDIDLSGAERLTAEAWIESDIYQGERLQALVSKWKPGNTLSAEAFDAFSDLTEAERPQRVGAVFDGRYIYYVPYGQSGVVLRFDTRGRFTDRTNWVSFDAGALRFDRLLTLRQGGSLRVKIKR